MLNVSISNNSKVEVEQLHSFSGSDLYDLCDSTEATIVNNDSFSIGFKRDSIPLREQMEAYWKGIVVMPQRVVLVGRVDGTIAASLQIVMPSDKTQTFSFAANVENHFVAPWARGYKLARILLEEAELLAFEKDISLLKISVRANQDESIQLYEKSGYKKWGTLEQYELVNGVMHAGHFYCKNLTSDNI